MWKYCLLSALIFVSIANAHVSLTYPPARKYDLDFIDNTRTQAPCGGMPQGSHKTKISRGSKLKVEWHLGYAHNGGFNIELLNGNVTIWDAASPNDWINTADGKFATSYVMDVPNIECTGCVLKFRRQATEWDNYQFWSCADVDILANVDNDDCGGHGTPYGSGCNCDQHYFGDHCQYTQDCQGDYDCQNGGRCLENFGTSKPKRECYCPMGYFGRTCEKQSELSSKAYNESSYHKQDLGYEVKFLWKLIDSQNTLEGIIQAKTESYVAVGWRDKNSPTSCQSFPNDVAAPDQPLSLHPMDCQDMVIGKADGSFSNIGDFYTRDRSTPRRDEFYGGKDDLMAATGWEQDGYTTIMFRKPVASSDPSDNDFTGNLKLIYAYGQQQSDFYKKDDLKYHQHNKGSTDIYAPSASASSAALFYPLLTFCFLYVIVLH